MSHPGAVKMKIKRKDWVGCQAIHEAETQAAIKSSCGVVFIAGILTAACQCPGMKSGEPVSLWEPLRLQSFRFPLCKAKAGSPTCGLVEGLLCAGVPRLGTKRESQEERRKCKLRGFQQAPLTQWTTGQLWGTGETRCANELSPPLGISKCSEATLSCRCPPFHTSCTSE